MLLPRQTNSTVRILKTSAHPIGSPARQDPEGMYGTIRERMEDYLTAQQAADLLHLHPKRVQALARAGKLPAVRAGRKWLFPRAALLARLRGSTSTAVASAAQLSGRNQIKGRITAISVDGVMAEVRIEIGGHELVSIITRASVERLGLQVGDEATAVIKATDVMIGRA